METLKAQEEPHEMCLQLVVFVGMINFGSLTVEYLRVKAVSIIGAPPILLAGRRSEMRQRLSLMANRLESKVGPQTRHPGKWIHLSILA